MIYIDTWRYIDKERKYIHKSLYYYIAEGATTEIGGISRLVMAYNGIVIGDSPFTMFCITYRIAQLVLILPMV